MDVTDLDAFFCLLLRGVLGKLSWVVNVLCRCLHNALALSIPFDLLCIPKNQDIL